MNCGIVKSLKCRLTHCGNQNAPLRSTGDERLEGNPVVVVDNQIMGTDASYLNSLNPNEVESINVSTNPSDVQKYTAMNSVGIVEVTMKNPLLVPEL